MTKPQNGLINVGPDTGSKEIVVSAVHIPQDFAISMRKPIRIIGFLLAILGIIGIVFPNFLSIAIEVYLGWMMIVGGFLWLYYAFKLHVHSIGGWIKPIILLVAGGLWLANPTVGIAALTLLISFYLFADAFGGFSMAFERRSQTGWGWMIFNGLVSLVLALMILIGWPATSAFYLGIFVGVSLLFDGLSMIMLSLSLKKV